MQCQPKLLTYVSIVQETLQRVLVAAKGHRLHSTVQKFFRRFAKYDPKILQSHFRYTM